MIFSLFWRMRLPRALKWKLEMHTKIMAERQKERIEEHFRTEIQIIMKDCYGSCNSNCFLPWHCLSVRIFSILFFKLEWNHKYYMYAHDIHNHISTTNCVGFFVFGPILFLFLSLPSPLYFSLQQLRFCFSFRKKNRHKHKNTKMISS